MAQPMLITGVETVPLRIPFKDQTSADAAWGPAHLPAVHALLVKVTTDQGYEGWGEAFGLQATAATQRAIDDLITPLCLGRDASRIAALMRDLQEKLQAFGRGGPVIYGLSAVDIALWDIAGKAAGLPLHRLVGGGATDLACYASLEAYSEPSLVRARVRQAIDAGFTSLKLHETELPAIRAAREEAGPDPEIMVDVNCAWSLGQARGLDEDLRELALKWLEEPVWPPENYDALAELRRTEGIATPRERTWER